MSNFRSLFWACLCFCLWMYGRPALALDVTAEQKINADAALAWCATEPAVDFAEVLSGACVLQVTKAGDLARGFSRQVFWLRLTLENNGALPIERWISVGHPRLEELSLFVADKQGGWRTFDSGNRVPQAQRDEIARSYGAFALQLAANASQVIWLRVASRTATDLTTIVWPAAAFRETYGRGLFSFSLALGALLIVMLFSLLVYAVSREWPYLFFAVSMLGEIVLESFRSGLLQRYAWPVDLVMPVEIAALGSLLAVCGFTGFFHSFVPGLRRRSWLYRIFRAFFVLTVAAQLWSVFVDYQAGAQIWSLTVNGMLISGMSLTWLIWRNGVRSAGVLFLSFILLAVLEVLRLGSAFGFLPFFWAETMAGPWALVMTTPAFLLSILQRSQELRDKLIQAKAENSSKISFLTQMSHELRTPLDTILGYSQLLAKPNGQELAPDGLDSIQQSGKHLLGMIDEILDHAKGVAGKLRIEPVPVGCKAFLDALEQNALVLAEKNNNRFSMQYSDLPVECLQLDAGRLRQVLDNLLANAFRHTSNGRVDVSLSAELQPDGWVHLNFRVSDTGEGIAQTDLARIFLPFERSGKNSHQGGKGAGMGLTIAKQLIEAMGGELSVVSELGKGSCFSFNLMAEICDNPVTELGGLTLADYLGRQRTIVVVEDDRAALHILSAMLRVHGFFVVELASAKDISGVVRHTPHIDLVLTDQFMGDSDGWSALKEAGKYWPEVPVILMSSGLPQPPEDFPSSLSFSCFLQKPLDHQVLLRCIGDLLHLDWRLADSEPCAREVALSIQDFPDNETLQDLRAMIRQGMLTDMMDWALALKTKQTRYTTFADKVYAAAYGVDFPALKALGKMSE